MKLSLRLLQVREPSVKKHLTNADRRNISDVINHLEWYAGVIYIHNSKDRNENIFHGKLLDDIEKLRKTIGNLCA